MNHQRIEILKKYISEDPSDSFSKYALALELVKEGNDQEAGRYLEMNYDNDPSYLPNYYHYGKLLERTGHPAKAIIIYEKGMEIARQKGDFHTLAEISGALEALT